MSQKISHSTAAAGEPLVVVAKRAVGVRKAFRVLTFMAAWDRARRAMLRESITLDEYAEWWKESRSTAFREQALFRQAFPGETTPDRLLDVATVQWDDRKGIAALGAVLYS